MVEAVSVANDAKVIEVVDGGEKVVRVEGEVGLTKLMLNPTGEVNIECVKRSNCWSRT